jgi:hypothetical protein
MADGRSKKRAKSKRDVKRPQLRVSKSPAARAEAERRRAKRKAAHEAAARKPSRMGAPIRVRPEGFLGGLIQHLCAWLAVGAVVWVAFGLDRWNTISYPDSLWLFIAIGSLVAAPGLGYVARSMGDCWLWAFTTLVVATTLLVLEYIVGPTCPSDSCAAVGARGQYHVWGSLLIVFGAFVLDLVLGALSFRISRKHRKMNGFIAHRVTAGTSIFAFVLVGLPLAAAMVGGDAWARTEPGNARLAKTTVEQECFDFDENVPDLALRPSPSGRSSSWSDYAVGRAHESRNHVGKNTRITSADKDADASPYEAVVSINSADDVAFLSCRWISAKSGVAPQDSIKVEKFGASSPIKPTGDFVSELKAPTSTPAVTTKATTKKAAKAKK